VWARRVDDRDLAVELNNLRLEVKPEGRRLPAAP
jgi:hypothetical protein